LLNRPGNAGLHPGMASPILRGMNHSCRLVLVLLPGLLLTGCSAPALTGAWYSRVQFTSGDFTDMKDLEFMYAFHGDGTVTESSNDDGAPPVPPAYGVWSHTGGNRYEAFYVFYTTRMLEKREMGWGPAGRGEFSEKIELAPDGNSFESTIKLNMFDAAGKP